MSGGALAIERLTPQSPDLPLCAQWRHEAFLAEDGYSLADSLQQLVTLTSGGGGEAALLARIDGVAAGICMMVRNELDAAHDLSPWLASLYVAPAFRRRGVGRTLVRAIEGLAQCGGVERLYLYTGGAAGFYRRCGWTAAETFQWRGYPLTLMWRDVGAPA